MRYFLSIVTATFLILTGITAVYADEFTTQDLKEWEKEYQSVVKKGRQVFTDPKLGSNGIVCAQCHPNAADTHPGQGGVVAREVQTVARQGGQAGEVGQ